MSPLRDSLAVAFDVYEGTEIPRGGKCASCMGLLVQVIHAGTGECVRTYHPHGHETGCPALIPLRGQDRTLLTSDVNHTESIPAAGVITLVGDDGNLEVAVDGFYYKNLTPAHVERLQRLTDEQRRQFLIETGLPV